MNDSHEIVGNTQTVSSANGAVLQRAFLYTNGTMYNLTFYLVGGPTVLLSDAKWIDCQGNIAALGTPAAGGDTRALCCGPGHHQTAIQTLPTTLGTDSQTLVAGSEAAFVSWWHEFDPLDAAIPGQQK